MRMSMVTLAVTSFLSGWATPFRSENYGEAIPCQPDWGEDYGKHPNQVVVEHMRSYVKPYNHKFEANQRRWKHLQKYHDKKRKELLAKEARQLF